MIVPSTLLQELLRLRAANLRRHHGQYVVSNFLRRLWRNVADFGVPADLRMVLHIAVVEAHHEEVRSLALWLRGRGDRSASSMLTRCQITLQILVRLRRQPSIY